MKPPRKVADLTFARVDRPDHATRDEIKEFIERYEWLGTMPRYPTDRYTARYRGLLAGAVIMTPVVAHSRIIGPDTKGRERLIARGASISWAPKNLGSALIMYAVRDMVATTDRRIFYGYADREAGEVGIIYQACGFKYLGLSSGATKVYADPHRPDKWMSDKTFRFPSIIKPLAAELGIEWRPEWTDGKDMLWKNVPPDVAAQLHAASIELQKSWLTKTLPPKGKYVLVMGADKREARRLRALFEQYSGHLVRPYPSRETIEDAPLAEVA